MCLFTLILNILQAIITIAFIFDSFLYLYKRCIKRPFLLLSLVDLCILLTLSTECSAKSLSHIHPHCSSKASDSNSRLVPHHPCTPRTTAGTTSTATINTVIMIFIISYSKTGAFIIYLTTFVTTKPMTFTSPPFSYS